MATLDSDVSLEGKLEAATRAERLTGAHSLVKSYLLASAGIALVPVPLVDFVGITALQIKLVHGLAKHYGVPFQKNIAQSLVASLLCGGSSVLIVKGLVSLAKAVPVLGTLGSGSVAVSAVSVTYATGEVFTQHFESGGTLLDFDLEKAKSLFKRAVNDGKTAAEVAIEKTAEPSAGTPLEATPATAV